MNVIVSMTESLLDPSEVNEIRSKIVRTNDLLGIESCRSDYQKPVGGCNFDGSSVCSGGRARYLQRPDFRFIDGPMKIYPLLKVINKASNKELFARAHVLQAQQVSIFFA